MGSRFSKGWALIGCLTWAAVARAQDAPPTPEKAETVTTSVKESIKVKKNHLVTNANTLWDMAKFYYGDPYKWKIIYQANVDRIKDPHWIYPGQQFIIPGLDKMITIVKDAPQPQPKPVPSPKPAPPPPPEPEPEPEPVAYEREQSEEGIVVPDDLSVEIPEGMAGQQPSLYRMKMSDTWKPDGEVTEFKDRESMAAAGDLIAVSIPNLSVRKRQVYEVFRRAAATEADVDQTAQYRQKVGIIEIIRRLSPTEYRARVLESGGSVQKGDQIKLVR